jgi:hypothetical protein
MDFAGRKWQIVPAQEQRMSGGQLPQQGRQKKSSNVIASPSIFGPSIPQPSLLVIHRHFRTSRSGGPRSAFNQKAISTLGGAPTGNP